VPDFELQPITVHRSLTTPAPKHLQDSRNVIGGLFDISFIFMKLLKNRLKRAARDEASLTRSWEEMGHGTKLLKQNPRLGQHLVKLEGAPLRIGSRPNNERPSLFSLTTSATHHLKQFFYISWKANDNNELHFG
jgi:hypothetical protein